MIYEVLDMPPLPENTDFSCHEKYHDYRIKENIPHYVYRGSPQLQDWLKTNFILTDGIPIIIGIMIIHASTERTHFIRHIDMPGRLWTFNYILDPGGDNVETRFFKSMNLNEGPIKAHICKPKTWYLLETQRPHDVINLSCERSMLTIFPEIRSNIALTNFMKGKSLKPL